MYEKIVEYLLSSSYQIAFTGAGMSTGSGISDFRGPNGLWKRYSPEIASADFLRKDPKSFWEFYSVRMRGLFEASANPSHKALAEMERMGLLKWVITQNIDGLHQQGGSRNVIEIHGTMRRSYCSTCFEPYESSEVLKMIDQGQNPPLCKCGGVIRPDVVLFGEPVKEIERALKIASRADLVMAIGTSLTVYPANLVPRTVKENGGRLIIVNMEETPLDEVADEVVRGQVEKVLPEIVEEIKSELGKVR
ncbi:NAD-dependent protein deacetylase [Sulfuracidifex tepidarius]|uniref:NAD-dependent protein deacetylase n=1 Tax=Sulfuracidifex tepidarius TaxID=1294262 RepID=A0A510DUE0_9CREN|nr:NAD-dependent protein deacetylase [Sulfuracidifex tepidarius]BBG23638.1 NAD-dependent protein deacetylase [Sulfuracidifex tepidarius]